MANEETKQILPEVVQYAATREEAIATWKATDQAINEEHPPSYGYSDEAFEQRRLARTKRDESFRVQSITINEAWNELKTSTDPLVRWIAENCKEYQGEATQILEVLPASLDELDNIAADAEWCYIWGQFRESAMAAGALPGVVPRGPAFKAVLEQIKTESSCCPMSASGNRRITQRLEELVAEAKAAATESLVVAA